VNKSDLEKWRFHAPLLIVSNALIPIAVAFVKDLDLVTKVSAVVLLPLSWMVAYFYSAMRLRNFYWLRELDRHVGAQIRSELVSLVPADLDITDQEKERLREKEIWKKLTGVFWEAIDSDAQLVRQKEHFYANGVFYSTAVDLYVILTVTSIIYSALGICTQQSLFTLFSGIWLAVGVLSRLLILPSCRKRHLELSREQLDLLKRVKHDFVSERFRDIILGWRSTQRAAPSTPPVARNNEYRSAKPPDAGGR
jgi:hypothetical protein